MGSVVIGGMLAASGIAIFLIPLTFYVVEKFSHKGDNAAEGGSGGGTGNGETAVPPAVQPAVKEEGDSHA
jgi:HAE1 family hydrophobic/amphiphilic exporter-1